MGFPKRLFAALEAWFLRRTAALAHPRAPRRAMWLVPVLFGLLSVGLGQDQNWDLRNYHWYNAYALLNGRLDIDMAPGQWQSYFNPLIDLPYYLLSTTLPGPVVGFLMGYVHGLNFVLLLAIGRRLLGERADGARLALLLALSGTCGAAFLSELGNTMGDNLTALLVLSSLLLVLRRWEALQAWSAAAASLMLLSGLLMGLGTGLKLTNATYAAALCIALLLGLPAPLRARFALAFTQGCGVLAGMLVTGGYWWLEMWERFGNPLFPQFNNIFRSPLAQQLGVIDDFHLPRHALEALFWPFVFAIDAGRVSEIPLKIAVVPVLYALALLFLVVLAVEGVGGRKAHARLSPRARFILIFALVAYLAWMKLFGIYRYLVPLELLAPLLIWILIERLAAPGRAVRIGGWLLAATTIVVFPFNTWGHGGWASPNFSAQVPPLARPAATIVFTAHGDPPMGWLATFFPQDVKLIALAGGFPESPAYLERIQAAVGSRPGPHYVMLAAARSDKENSLQRKRALADFFGFTASTQGCARLEKLARRLHADVKAGAEPGRACTLELPQRYLAGLPEQDRALMQAARQGMRRYGLRIDEAACKTYPAALGATPFPFRFCPVTAER